MPTPLHPNLARLAAAYDQIVSDHQSGRLGSREARGRIAALVGRDDTGLLWAINPDSGRWGYRNLRGELVEADPPRFGIASPSPSDLGAGPKGDLDGRLTYFEVDPEPFKLQPVPIDMSESRVRRVRSARTALRKMSSSDFVWVRKLCSSARVSLETLRDRVRRSNSGNS